LEAVHRPKRPVVPTMKNGCFQYRSSHAYLDKLTNRLWSLPNAVQAKISPPLTRALLI